MSDLFHGTVSWYRFNKGYGFITVTRVPDESWNWLVGQDIFVHYKDVLGNGWRGLTANSEVSIEMVRTNRPDKFFAQGVRITKYAYRVREVKNSRRLQNIEKSTAHNLVAGQESADVERGPQSSESVG